MTNEVWYTDLRAANIARQKEWDAKSVLDLSFKSNELVGEIGELIEKVVDLLLFSIASGRLANYTKKLERERLGLKGSRATIEDVGEELADIRIINDLVGLHVGINVDQVTRDKFNATSIKLGLSTRLGEPTPAPDRFLGQVVKIKSGFQPHERWRVVSLRIDPDKQVWACVTEMGVDNRHRGYGIYDGEMTDILLDQLEIDDNGKG